MAGELTPEGLRAIEERHKAAAPGIRRAEEALRLAPTHYQDHHDIGLLLGLLRRVARTVPPTMDERDMGAILTLCTCCSAVQLAEAHTPTCPMPLLDALRETP